MGYMFTLGSDPISWRSMLQGVVKLSTAEAKYIAMIIMSGKPYGFRI